MPKDLLPVSLNRGIHPSCTDGEAGLLKAVADWSRCVDLMIARNLTLSHMPDLAICGGPQEQGADLGDKQLQDARTSESL